MAWRSRIEDGYREEYSGILGYIQKIWKNMKKYVHIARIKNQKNKKNIMKVSLQLLYSCNTDLTHSLFLWIRLNNEAQHWINYLIFTGFHALFHGFQKKKMRSPQN